MTWRRAALALEPRHSVFAGIAAAVLGFLSSPQETLAHWCVRVRDSSAYWHQAGIGCAPSLRRRSGSSQECPPVTCCADVVPYDISIELLLAAFSYVVRSFHPGDSGLVHRLLAQTAQWRRRASEHAAIAWHPRKQWLAAADAAHRVHVFDYAPPPGAAVQHAKPFAPQMRAVLQHERQRQVPQSQRWHRPTAPP